jgi:hypothetical protein
METQFWQLHHSLYIIKLEETMNRKGWKGDIANKIFKNISIELYQAFSLPRKSIFLKYQSTNIYSINKITFKL